MEEITKVFGIDWRLLLIQIINFAILLFLLKIFLYKPIMKIIDERKVKIEKGMADAEEATVKLGLAEESAHKMLQEAQNKAEKLTEETYDLLRQFKDEKTKEAEEDGQKILAAAEKEKKTLRERAVREAEEEVTRMSILGAEKILKEKNV